VRQRVEPLFAAFVGRAHASDLACHVHGRGAAATSG
jgi:hypothetical protein